MLALLRYAEPVATLWPLSAGTIASLGKAIAGQVGNFDPRSLTDALWGFAKLGGKLDGSTISKLAQRVKELASKFKPQEAANALWALVKLDQANGGNAMKVSHPNKQSRDSFYRSSGLLQIAASGSSRVRHLQLRFTYSTDLLWVDNGNDPCQAAITQCAHAS